MPHLVGTSWRRILTPLVIDLRGQQGWEHFVSREAEHWLLTMMGLCVCVLVAQSHPTLCNPMDCSPPGSSVHGILQTRILEWIAISPPVMALTQGLNFGPPYCRQILYHWVTREALDPPTFENCVLTRDAVVPATPCPDPAVHNSIIWMGWERSWSLLQWVSYTAGKTGCSLMHSHFPHGRNVGQGGLLTLSCAF